eukprot:6192395-Pleurochrysis_carterae.AAC.5
MSVKVAKERAALGSNTADCGSSLTRSGSNLEEAGTSIVRAVGERAEMRKCRVAENVKERHRNGVAAEHEGHILRGTEVIKYLFNARVAADQVS